MQNTMALRPTLRLLFSAAMIFAVLAAVAGVSGALLTTNPATATGNTFSVATAGLEIAQTNTEESFSTTVSDAFNAENLVPGGDPVEFEFFLRNSSSADIDLHLFADLANYSFEDGAANPLTAGGTDIDNNLTVNFSCFNTTTASTGDTPSKSMSSWSSATPSGTEQFDETSTILLGTNEIADCTMTVALLAGAEDADHTANFDAIFTGEQVSVGP